MGKQKNKLVLDKNTVKSIKVRTNVKTGTIGSNGGDKTENCNGGITGGSGPISGSANYSRAASTIR